MFMALYSRRNIMQAPLRKITLLLLAFVMQQPAVARIIFYHNDGLGSPVVASDEQGNVLWSATYHPYGNRTQSPHDYADSLDNDRWYTGHSHDDALGLTYMQARYYDPVIGRFISVDPLAFSEGDPQTFNRYAYAKNNPYKYFDPNGLDAVVVSWNGTAAVGGGVGIGGGLYFTYPGQDDAQFDFGSIATVSGVLGADVSFTGNVSTLHGGRENVEGTSIRSGATIPLTGITGPAADFESIINKDTGKWAGQSVGVGFAAFPSMSTSISETFITFSMRDWMQSTEEVAAPQEQLTDEELTGWYQFIAN
jgi:RHS repeat-associated protein